MVQQFLSSVDDHQGSLTALSVALQHGAVDKRRATGGWRRRPRPWALEAVVEREGTTLKRGGDATRDHNQAPGAPPRQRAHAAPRAARVGARAERENGRPSRTLDLEGGSLFYRWGDQRNTRTTSRHSSPHQPVACNPGEGPASARRSRPPAPARHSTWRSNVQVFVSRFRATPSAHATPVNCVAASPQGPAEPKPTPQHVPSTGDPERPTYR